MTSFSAPYSIIMANSTPLGIPEQETADLSIQTHDVGEYFMLSVLIHLGS